MVSAWFVDSGNLQLVGVLMGAGVILAGLWWWGSREKLLPEVEIWNAAVTRSFLEEHLFMEGFYRRRLDALTRLVDRLPPKRREELGGMLDGDRKCLEHYLDAIREHEEREVIPPSERWLIVSREAAVQESLQKLASQVSQWYRNHSRHEKLKSGSRGISMVLARVPLLREFFQWKRVLIQLAERSQTVSARQMVAFRLAEKGSALHARASGFFKLIRTPTASSREIRTARRVFRGKLVSFARAVMDAQVEGGERTLILAAAGEGGRAPWSHDPLGHLKRKALPAGELVLSEVGLEKMRGLWARFDQLSEPVLSHYEGYLNFVVFDEELSGALHPELAIALRKSMCVRVLDKVTDEWEVVDFEVHFGRFLVFKAHWFARAREVEVRMSRGPKEQVKGFALETVEHRAVMIRPRKTAE